MIYHVRFLIPAIINAFNIDEILNRIMSAVVEVNNHLAAIFRNGRAEVGLEVGADPGLPTSDWIQVPSSLRRSFAVRYEVAEGDANKKGKSVQSMVNKKGWLVVSPDEADVTILAGKMVIQKKGVKVNGALKKGPEYPFQIQEVMYDPFDLKDIQMFVAANVGHIQDDKFSDEQTTWIHATRFWALVSGLVAGTKNREFTVVPDPLVDLAPYDPIARAIVVLRESVLTASAARAASWRKTNHATGGEIAVGFPRRWLQKSGYWSTTGDKDEVRNFQKRATDAFYLATHATAVHNVLALMAPSDESHWARVDPSFGLITKWDVRTSTEVRIAPKTQVAGAAMVVDAYQVMKMLVSEGIFPLCQNASAWKGLVSQYQIVAQSGVRVASYASWFMDGHPQNLEPVAFNQKAAICADLVGELAAVARTYYRRSTIGESMALDNAMQQLASESAKEQWSALSRAKGDATAEEVVKAYKSVAGKGAGALVGRINGSSLRNFDLAITDYNSMTSTVAAALDLPNPVVIEAEKVRPGDRDAEDSSEEE